MQNRHEREAALFEAMLQLPSAQRMEYLEKSCRADAELKQRIIALLKVEDNTSVFLEPRARLSAAGSPNPRSVPAEKPGDIIGHYKLLQQIGEGGCGVVYMAEQEQPVQRRVALKVIKLGMDTKSVVARFDAERRALALMDHPNIARVLDAGATETGRPYFVMELVRGMKITEYCDENNCSTRERLDLFVQVCRAVQHAHQKGIIHRDLKPANILVTVNDGIPIPKVIDFGIAKATQGRLTDQTVFTAFEQFIGTPAYMSPEQAAMTSLDVDTRSDVYSLGVLLYELLTGKTPFDTKELLAIGLAEMRRTICEKEPARPSTRLSTLGEGELASTARRRKTEPPHLIHAVRDDLDWIVMKCLEKERARRYETASGLAMDIERHLGHEPIAARPAGKFYSFQKMVKRNRGAVAALAIVAVTLIVATAVSTWEAVRAERSEHEQAHVRQMAQAEAAKSRQVSRLLEDMLASVGDSVAQGRDTTLLREILDKTVARMGKDLTNQPEVEVELRNTLGEAYLQLGVYAEAAQMADEAVKIGSRRFGKDNLAVAESLTQLGWAQWFVGPAVHEQAEHNLREAVEIRRKRLGEENALVADALQKLAYILCDRGKHQESVAVARQALVLDQKLFGNEDVRVAASLASLARQLRREGDIQEAESVARQALTLHRKLLGSQNLQTAATINKLASILLQEGKLAEAEALMREALGTQRQLLGKIHPELTTTLRVLGEVLLKEGKLQEAEAKLREAVIIQQRTARPVYPGMAGVLFRDLTQALKSQGKFSEVGTLLRDEVSLRRKLEGDETPNAVPVLCDLAELLSDQGKLPEAEGAAREALVVARKLPAGHSALTSDALRKLGIVLFERGNNSEAERCLREAVAIDEEMNSKSWRRSVEYWSERHLAAVLYREEKFSEAETYLRKTLAISKIAKHSQEDRVVKIRLAQALLRQGKLTEAEAFSREALDHADANALNEWAWFLASDRAEHLWQATNAVHYAEEAVAMTSRTNASFVDTLAAAYAKTGDFGKAVAVEKEAIALLTQEKERDDCTKRLKLYESNTPYLEP